MSKTILANVDGFTPVIDDLARQYGLVRAAVFGRIWRYCQMPEGICRASLETISDDLGVDRATILRHAQSLVEDGYLEDTTPELRNRPHIYRDTGKAGITISIGVAQRNSQAGTVAHSNIGVAQRNVTVAESQLKKGVKKDSNKETDSAAPADATFESVKKLYTQNIGLPTPIILESLRDACALYTPQWVDMAIREAVLNSARSWRYIATCLENWKTNGLKHRAERAGEFRRGPARRMASAPTKTIHDHFTVRQINALYRANMTGAQAQHIASASLTYEAALAYVTGVQNGGATD